MALQRGSKKGIRKDAISHGLYAFIFEKYGTFTEYFKHLDKVMPGKPADMIAKYIPSEIEHTGRIEQAHTLNVILPEPRRVLPSNVKHLDVIAVDGCKADSTIDAEHSPAGETPQVYQSSGVVE